MKLPDGVYDVLKWLACIALDAIGEFYASMADIWGWPYGEQVYHTFVRVSILIGILIGVSTAEYRKSLLEASNMNATNSFFVNSDNDEDDESVAQYYEQQMNDIEGVDEFEYFESK